MFISHFVSVAPRFSAQQEESLRWLAWSHAQTDPSRTPEDYAKLLHRVACGPAKITSRSYELPFYCSFSEESAALLRTFTISQRMRFFEEIADDRLNVFYLQRQGEGEAEASDALTAPGLLIHVSCTGYVSPSAAQKLVMRKGWRGQTGILHAYHMGCYAALPCLRHAADHAQVHGTRVDIFHSELCTLHLDPRQHDAEQLVVQSLFADGHIGYSVSPQLEGKPGAQGQVGGRGFELLTVREEIVPDTLDLMTWRVSEQGFQMTLAREIPEVLRTSIGEFIARLADQACIDASELAEAIYAIHPGGPRIVDLISKTLGLADWHLTESLEILRSRGNMSSATLPHIWQRILQDRKARDGQLVLSLAFGPGLTIFGSLMRVKLTC